MSTHHAAPGIVLPNGLSRRDFLEFCVRGIGAASAGTLLLAGCDSRGGSSPVALATATAPPPARLGTLIAPGQFMHDGKTSFVLAMLDLDRASAPARYTDMSFFGHGIVPNPAEPSKAMIFQKKGKGCCEIDLVAGKVLRPVETRANQQFYGHGAYSLDASLLYSTETIVEGDYKGLIAIRDAKTMQIVDEFPTFGASPHDCKLVNAGKTMIITNGGGPINGAIEPSVTYVDVPSRRLLERVELSTQLLNTGHLALTDKGDLAVVSAPREGLPDQEKQKGGISLRPVGTTIETMTQPADVTDAMIGETLSVVIHQPTGVVAATNPSGNLITFWGLASRKLIKTMKAELPRGAAITLDGELFIFTCKKPNLLAVRTRDLEPASPGDHGQVLMTGSHAIAYAMPG